MSTLLWPRDLASDAANVKTTFSSWDTCMSKAYCKWPAIVGIIVASLIVLSLLTCLFRCLCCGVECCCGCLACCNACCPSPRRRGNRNNDGYSQAPPPPAFQPYPPYGAYASPAPPMYAQTATFDAPNAKQKYNADALPAMPSWSNATSRHVEEPVVGQAGDDEDVELGRYHSNARQEESLLPQAATATAGGAYGYPPANNTYYPQQPYDSAGGDLGTAAANPYHDYAQHQQYAPSPITSEYPPSSAAYPPTYYGGSATSTMYAPQPPQQWSGYNNTQQRGYADSIAAPSYHTRPPSANIVSPIASPPLPSPGGAQQRQMVGRKPVAWSWRDV